MQMSTERLNRWCHHKHRSDLIWISVQAVGLSITAMITQNVVSERPQNHLRYAGATWLLIHWRSQAQITAWVVAIYVRTNGMTFRLHKIISFTLLLSIPQTLIKCWPCRSFGVLLHFLNRCLSIASSTSFSHLFEIFGVNLTDRRNLFEADSEDEDSRSGYTISSIRQ